MKEAYLEAMSRAAHSVTVMTTDGPAGRAGVTVSAMCSVSLDGPAPTLLICIHEGSPVQKAIAENGVYCANLLCDDQTGISESFAGRTAAKGDQKFACAEWQTRATGAPVLINALASFDCRMVHHHSVGTHQIFIGQVASVESTTSGRPLVYHNRQYGLTEGLATI